MEGRRQVREISRFHVETPALARVHALTQTAEASGRRIPIPNEAQHIPTAIHAERQAEAACGETQVNP